MKHSRSVNEPRRARTPSGCEYELLADEYYDREAHPTCHNLNRLSRLFIEKELLEPWDGGSIVEVGAGDSCVAALLYARGYGLNGLTITDGSKGMLAHSAKWTDAGATLQLCQATLLSCSDESVHLLVASLGDPYNVPAFWLEAARVVHPGGTALFTMPSYDWSSRYRSMVDAPQDAAEFVTRSGMTVLVPSYVVSLAEQVRLMQSAGFAVARFESLGANNLAEDEPRSSKIDVFTDEVSSLVWGFRLTRRVDHPCARRH